MMSLHEAYAGVVDYEATQAQLAIKAGLEAVGAQVPDGFSVVPPEGCEQSYERQQIAPVLTFDEQTRFSESIQAAAPNYFRASPLSPETKALLQRPEVIESFGTAGMTPEKIGADRALWLPHAESVYMKLITNPGEVVAGDIGETSGKFTLGHRSGESTFVDRKAYITELLETDEAITDDNGRVWVKQFESVPVTRTVEAELIASFFRRLAADPASGPTNPADFYQQPTAVNQFVCIADAAGRQQPIAVTTVGWAAAHRAVAIASRRLT